MDRRKFLTGLTVLGTGVLLGDERSNIMAQNANRKSAPERQSIAPTSDNKTHKEYTKKYTKEHIQEHTEEHIDDIVTRGSVRFSFRRSDGKAISGEITICFVSEINRATSLKPRSLVSTDGDSVAGMLPAGVYRATIILPNKTMRIYSSNGVTADGTIIIQPQMLTNVEIVLEPAYNKVQFLGYLVLTGKRQGIDNICSSYEVQPTASQHKFNLEVSLKDLRARWEVLRSVIQQTYISNSVDHSADTLKVFVVPEFFYQGSQSGYPMTYLDLLIEWVAEELRGDKYQNWLFVLGSFVGYFGLLPGKRSSSSDVHFGLVAQGFPATASEEINVLNLCLIYKGGKYLPFPADELSGSQFNTTAKITVGMQDYNFCSPMAPKRQVIKMGDGKLVLKLAQQNTYEDLNTRFGYSELRNRYAKPYGEWSPKNPGGALVKLDGIVFGLEVCRDHTVGRLKNYYACIANSHEPRPQIQIMIAAGAEWNINNIVADTFFYTGTPDGVTEMSTLYLNRQTRIAEKCTQQVAQLPIAVFDTLFPGTKGAVGNSSPYGAISIFPTQFLPPLNKTL